MGELTTARHLYWKTRSWCLRPLRECWIPRSSHHAKRLSMIRSMFDRRPLVCGRIRLKCFGVVRGCSFAQGRSRASSEGEVGERSVKYVRTS